MKIEYTNGVPICPYCNKPTKRSMGIGTVTMRIYEPIYDEKGNNINPDRNIRNKPYHCHECGKDYAIVGNDVDGYEYKG